MLKEDPIRRESSNNKGRPKSRSRSKSKDKTKSKLKCFYCGKEGHIKNKCYKRIGDEKQVKKGNKIDFKANNKTNELNYNCNSMYSEVLCVAHFPSLSSISE